MRINDVIIHGQPRNRNFFNRAVCVLSLMYHININGIVSVYVEKYSFPSFNFRIFLVYSGLTLFTVIDEVL